MDESRHSFTYFNVSIFKHGVRRHNKEMDYRGSKSFSPTQSLHKMDFGWGCIKPQGDTYESHKHPPHPPPLPRHCLWR